MGYLDVIHKNRIKNKFSLRIRDYISFKIDRDWGRIVGIYEYDFFDKKLSETFDNFLRDSSPAADSNKKLFQKTMSLMKSEESVHIHERKVNSRFCVVYFSKGKFFWNRLDNNIKIKKLGEC
jgi:hypothetical protein